VKRRSRVLEKKIKSVRGGKRKKSGEEGEGEKSVGLVTRWGGASPKGKAE